MKEKRLKIGILFPDGEVKWLAYGASTKNGFVYGVSYSDTHITALPETHSVSFHLKNQSIGMYQHLGRLIKDGDYESLQLKALNPIILMDDGLDEKVAYITKRGMELLNQPSDILIETETDQERILILDLLCFFDNSKKMAHDLSQNYLKLFGACTAREILSNEEYEAGLTTRETSIIEVDGKLYEVDIKAYLDWTNMENPLQEIFTTLGFSSLLPELDKRFREVIEEKKESLEDYFIS